jgi:hypothetical protein
VIWNAITNAESPRPWQSFVHTLAEKTGNDLLKLLLIHGARNNSCVSGTSFVTDGMTMREGISSAFKRNVASVP